MHPSDSSAQRSIEIVAIDLLNRQLSCRLTKARIPMNDQGVFVEIDGYDVEQNILCEVYCGIDSLKPGQTKKVITDAFKLMMFEKVKQTPCRKILLFVDETIMHRFQQSKSWYSLAFKVLEIQTVAISIPGHLMEALRVVKRTQSR